MSKLYFKNILTKKIFLLLFMESLVRIANLRYGVVRNIIEIKPHNQGVPNRSRVLSFTR